MPQPPQQPYQASAFQPNPFYPQGQSFQSSSNLYQSQSPTWQQVFQGALSQFEPFQGKSRRRR
jgi:hypothetical protein